MLDLEQETQFETIQVISAAKEPYDTLWTNAVKLQAYHESWLNGPLLKVNAEEVEKEVS